MRSAPVVCALALAAAGCGSSGHFAAETAPPAPVDLSVLIGNSRVQLSPARVGAGPVLLLVTNQSPRNETLMVRRRRFGYLATTGPISPQSTAQLQVNFRTPGFYALVARRVAPAILRVGRSRRGGDSSLLQP
jgi:hypothetical protein